MNTCFQQQNPPCIGIEIDELTFDCQHLVSYANWTEVDQQVKRKRRYLLQYPEQKFQFIPNCDLYSNAPLLRTLWPGISFDRCRDLCYKNSRCKKFSYDFDTFICKIAAGRPGHFRRSFDVRKRHCFIRPTVYDDDVSSFRMGFERTIGYRLEDDQVDPKKNSVSCPSYSNYDLCLDTCLNQCLTYLHFNISCEYISVTYVNETLTCAYFAQQTVLVRNENSEIYVRYFNTKMDVSVIDKMPLFIPTIDMRSCFSPITSSFRVRIKPIYNYYFNMLSAFNQTRAVSSVPLIRTRRFLGFIKKAANWVYKNVVTPVADTVKEIVVDTPVNFVKAIKSLVKEGDIEAATDAFLDIPIVKNIKSTVENAREFGKAVAKGDFKGAINSLADTALDAVGTLPMPIAGKTVSKIGKGVTKSHKRVKDKLFKNKNEVQKPKNTKDTDKNARKKKKKEHCDKRRRRRALGKRDPECDDDNDEPDTNHPKCQRPNVNHNSKIDPLSINDCISKSIGSRCDYDCKSLYEPYYKNGVSCRRDPAYKKRGVWEPKPKCVPVSCPSGDFPIISIGTKGISHYAVLFDKKRKLPAWSISLLDVMNRVKVPEGKRKSNYPHHPCLELKNHQAGSAAYRHSGYDHGHLTPSEILSYSSDASHHSNLRINLAPQDPITNKIPWRIIEAHIRCHNNKYPASLVVTGICPKSRGKTKAVGGVDIPACFWKMICYNRNGKTHVVGFVSDNRKLQKGDKSKIAQILKPVSQHEILKHLESNHHYFRTKNPFIHGFSHIFRGRPGAPTIDVATCISANHLDPAEANAWEIDFLLKQTKNIRIKRASSANHEARGCTPTEALEIAGLFGLKSLDIFDDTNYDNTDVSDVEDDDENGHDSRHDSDVEHDKDSYHDNIRKNGNFFMNLIRFKFK